MTAEDFNRLLAEAMENMDSQIDISAQDGQADPDDIMSNIMRLLNTVSFSSDMLTMKLVPTVDPLVYKMIAAGNFGNMSPSALNPDGGGSWGFDTSYDVSVSPILVMGSMLRDFNSDKTGIIQDVKEVYANNKDDYSSVNLKFSVGGYWEAEIRFNRLTKQWDCITVGGGWNAGGGVEFEFVCNSFAGPVPVTFEVKIGAELEFFSKFGVLTEDLSGSLPYARAWTDDYQDALGVNDWLFMMRLVAYARCFAGVGYDYSVMALKLALQRLDANQ